MNIELLISDTLYGDVRITLYYIDLNYLINCEKYPESLQRFFNYKTKSIKKASMNINFTKTIDIQKHYVSNVIVNKNKDSIYKFKFIDIRQGYNPISKDVINILQNDKNLTDFLIQTYTDNIQNIRKTYLDTFGII